MRPAARYTSPNYNSSGSSTMPSFDRPDIFKKGKNGRKHLWYCDVCRANASSKYMSLKAAQEHERGAEHLRALRANESSWTMPNGDWTDWGAVAEEPRMLSKEEQKDNEHRVFVDQLHEFVPFWIRGVEAAQLGGEALKMEDFLKSHEKYPSMREEEPWGGWGMDIEYTWPGERAWPKEREYENESMDSARAASDKPELTSMPGFGRSGRSDVTIGSVVSERELREDRERAHEYDAHAFVEDIALQEAVDTERKKNMHMFFEMSTQQKVERIDDLIRSLRANPL